MTSIRMRKEKVTLMTSMRKMRMKLFQAEINLEERRGNQPRMMKKELTIIE